MYFANEYAAAAAKYTEALKKKKSGKSKSFERKVEL